MFYPFYHRDAPPDLLQSKGRTDYKMPSSVLGLVHGDAALEGVIETGGTVSIGANG
jgi:hypothetical protein